jgi:uncharacterized membrane protein YiaA
MTRMMSMPRLQLSLHAAANPAAAAAALSWGAAVASALFMVGLWVTGLQPAPKVDRGFMLALMPVALFHTIGHVSACVSFSQVGVLRNML